MTHRPPRVAIFASSYAPHLGGVEELVRQLAAQLRARGGVPLVVTMRWPKDLPSTEVIEDTEVRRHVFRLPERRPRWLAAYALEGRRIQRAIHEQLVEHGTELVHVQCVSGNGWYAYRAAKALGLPLVVTLQGELTMDANNVYATSSILPKLLKRLMVEADAVTACSLHTLREAEASTGVDLGARGHVIHNGVDIDEFDAAEPEVRERPYVLAIGRHVPQKGFDVLLDAFAIARANLAERVELVVAGDGPERAALEAQSERLGVRDSVSFVGRTGRQRTAALFRGCRAFVLPSRHEPQGIVNLEAMAARRAVIATRVGGVPEIVVDGETGVLIQAGDAGALATALRRVEDTSAMERLGAAGRRRSEQFTWPLVCDRYQNLYEQLLDA